jgi:hypothetical protein
MSRKLIIILFQSVALLNWKQTLDSFSLLQNEKLKETLSEERKGVGHYLVDLTQQKKRISQNLIGLEKEVSCPKTTPQCCIW